MNRAEFLAAMGRAPCAITARHDWRKTMSQIELAYSSKAAEPRVLFVWKLLRGSIEPPWPEIEQDAHAWNLPADALQVVRREFGRHRSRSALYVQPPYTDGPAAIYLELEQRCVWRLREDSGSLWAWLDDHVTTDVRLQRVRDVLRPRLFQRQGRSVIAAWNATASGAAGHDLYVGSRAADDLLEVLSTHLEIDSFHDTWSSWRNRALFSSGRPGLAFLKVGSDGSHSLHMCGLSWEGASEIEARFCANAWVANLRTQTTKPPDILGLGVSPALQRYVSGYYFSKADML